MDEPVQQEFPLRFTTNLAEGLLPKEIVLLWVHTRRTYWGDNPDYDPDCMGFGCKGRLIQQSYETKTLGSSTFDEVSAVAHVEKFGTKREETEVHGNKDITETWLSLQKIQFQQLNGVRLLVPKLDVYANEHLAKQQQLPKAL